MCPDVTLEMYHEDYMLESRVLHLRAFSGVIPPLFGYSLTSALSHRERLFLILLRAVSDL